MHPEVSPGLKSASHLRPVRKTELAADWSVRLSCEKIRHHHMELMKFCSHMMDHLKPATFSPAAAVCSELVETADQSEEVGEAARRGRGGARRIKLQRETRRTLMCHHYCDQQVNMLKKEAGLN